MNIRNAYSAFSYEPGLLSLSNFGHSSKYSSNYYPSLNNSAISSNALYLNFHAFDFNLAGIGSCYCSPSCACSPSGYSLISNFFPPPTGISSILFPSASAYYAFVGSGMSSILIGGLSFFSILSIVLSVPFFFDFKTGFLATGGYPPSGGYSSQLKADFLPIGSSSCSSTFLTPSKSTFSYGYAFSAFSIFSSIGFSSN